MSKISVIIPTYNYAGFVTQAIESVLAQTYKNFEIIVIDDGSTDDTKEVLRPYMNKVRYIYTENGGPSRARNLGVKNSKGEYVAFLDSDDLYSNDYLEKCINNLSDNSGDLVMTDSYSDFYDDTSKLIKREYLAKKNYVGNETKLIEQLFNHYFVQFPVLMGILIKKSCFEKIGYLDEKLGYVEDLDLWFRIAGHNLKIAYLQEPLYIYRRHSHSLCRNRNKIKMHLNAVYSVYEKNKKLVFRKDKSLRKLYGEILWSLGTNGLINMDLLFGTKCLIKSQVYHFSYKKIRNSVRTFLKSLFLRSQTLKN